MNGSYQWLVGCFLLVLVFIWLIVGLFLFHLGPCLGGDPLVWFFPRYLGFG